MPALVFGWHFPVATSTPRFTLFIFTAKEGRTEPPGPDSGQVNPTARFSLPQGSPAHVKGLRQTHVQLEVAADQVPCPVALPVQYAVADVICHVHRNQRELLQDRHPTDQPLQIPVRLHSDEGGAPALILRQTRESSLKEGGRGENLGEARGETQCGNVLRSRYFIPGNLNNSLVV